MGLKFAKVMVPTLFRLSMILVAILQFKAIEHSDNQTTNQMCEINDGFVVYPYGLQGLSGIGIYVLPFSLLVNTLKPVSIHSHYYAVP